MNSNGILNKHWFHVSLHFVCDALIFCVGFFISISLRFGEDAAAALGSYWILIVFGAVALSCATYIFGLYSTHSFQIGFLKRVYELAFAVLVALGCTVALAYLDLKDPLGRGATLIGGGISYVAMLVHHAYLLHSLRNTRERVAYVVTSPFDEEESQLLQSFGGSGMELVGVIERDGYASQSPFPVLGRFGELGKVIRTHRITRVLATHRALNDPLLCAQFCQLRYSGVKVMPLVSLCEEVEQYVPLQLITSDWLLNASGEPHMLYICKIKRLFDVVISLLGLLVGTPLVLLAMLAIKIFSPGPVFYRQTRCGRFGQIFEILKLRTMCVDAEKQGAVWWSGASDPRVTFVGRFLRKYRIDEIPQLVNVLLGQMSFVGPRPERPEMVEKLAQEIPFYKERLMIQPGLTGWAQVNYPYGASVADARRKLEFDFYYMKNMSIFLDLFILLDTVRIVLKGGIQHAGQVQSKVEEVSSSELAA